MTTDHGFSELGKAPTAIDIKTAKSNALYIMTKAVEDKVHPQDPSVLWAEIHQGWVGNTLS